MPLTDLSQAVISLPSYLFALANLLILAVAIALLTFFTVRGHRTAWRCIGMGAVCFFVSAMVLEQLLHSLVLGAFPDLTSHPVAYMLYASLAAGVFEETARLIGLRRLCRGDNGPRTGFAYGIGHGGVELLLLGVYPAWQTLVTFYLINSGELAKSVSGLTDAQMQTLLSQVSALQQTAPALFLLGGVERLMAMGMQLALSMLVWMVVTGRLSRRWFAGAVVLHAVLDVPAALYQCGVLPLLTCELLIAVLLVAAAALVLRLYRRTAA